MNSRRSRLRRLFGELYRQGPLSNQELADYFALSPASITNMIQPLLNNGLLRILPPEAYPTERADSALREHRRRRKATLTPAPDFGHMLVLELGSHHYALRCINFALHLTEDLPVLVHLEEGQNMVESICTQIAGMEKSAPSPLLAVGITVSARQDPGSGRLSFARDCPLEGEGDVASILSQRLGVPCIMENDANALALFERYLGNGRESEHFMCLYINEGAGIGIMANGHLYRGWRNQAGETGHWITNPAGPSLPGTPRGGFEATVSRSALHRQLEAAGVHCIESRAWLELAARCAKEGPEAARFRQIADALIDQCALLCVNLYHLFAPRHIFVYGPLAELCPEFGTALLERAKALTSPERCNDLDSVIRLRKDWAEAMAIGTARAAIDQVLDEWDVDSV